MRSPGGAAVLLSRTPRGGRRASRPARAPIGPSARPTSSCARCARRGRRRHGRHAIRREGRRPAGRSADAGTRAVRRTTPGEHGRGWVAFDLQLAKILGRDLLAVRVASSIEPCTDDQAAAVRRVRDQDDDGLVAAQPTSAPVDRNERVDFRDPETARTWIEETKSRSRSGRTSSPHSDAWSAFGAIRSDGAAAVAQRINVAHAATLTPILDIWTAWFAARSGYEAPSAWNAERASYTFELVASVEDRDVVLAADRYRGGHLDWTDLEGHVEPSSGQVAPQSRTATLLPTPIEFAGAPSPRFFELEDHSVRFTTIAGNAPDVATALLVEVALVYGNDWFVVPVTAPVSLVRDLAPTLDLQPLRSGRRGIRERKVRVSR